MFEIYFSFSSVIFTNDIKEFFYSLLASNEETIINRKLIKIIHKINMNKTLKINEMINKTLKQLVASMSK